MKKYLVFLGLTALLAGCNSTTAPKENSLQNEADSAVLLNLDVQTWIQSALPTEKSQPQHLVADNWLSYEVTVQKTGRYQLSIFGTSEDGATLWVEDYADNALERTFYITRNQQFDGEFSVTGIPLAAGDHLMKIHCTAGEVHLENVTFSLIQQIPTTPKVVQANMSGNVWALAWSDEFDGEGLPDSTKWTYNIGDWGWGNNELQYYTKAHLENARLENGNLVIEAHKVDGKWTSARLTTQGKVAFKNGKITIRAKVPTGRGNWSAGWLLGDTYQDELSWPTCGEIDILECVGYEIDDSSGNGYNHTSCHTPAYYFKKNNQITGKIALDSMHTKFHDYTVIWYADKIEGYVNDVHYYTYDKNATPEEWPFETPQNLILNLAMGGGWGGAKGVDEKLTKQTLFIDYVRVYELKE